MKLSSCPETTRNTAEFKFYRRRCIFHVIRSLEVVAIPAVTPIFVSPICIPKISLEVATTVMAFVVGGRNAVTRQAATSKFAAFHRYRAIRNFFRQEHIAALRESVPPSKKMPIYPGILKRRVHGSFAGLESGTRSAFHSFPLWNSLRTFTTQNTTPEKPPQSDEKEPTPPRDSKAHPPEENIIDAGNNFPHARDHENYSRFFRRLAESVPHARRPTRDDLLKVATNFWQRLSIRFKWFTLRSFRKFNADDISAFISWFLVSQTLWILIGTYVFFGSLVLSFAVETEYLTGPLFFLCYSQL